MAILSSNTIKQLKSERNRLEKMKSEYREKVEEMLDDIDSISGAIYHLGYLIDGDYQD